MGTFPTDAKVVLLGKDGGKYCRVVDGQGLYVEVGCSSLETLGWLKAVRPPFTWWRRLCYCRLFASEIDWD